ncbi:MAG: UDP-N-acetylglucosamine 2-epimerase (hydrolyzing) [Candidatus Marinimicrobia bacterium]|nr:UDP-N-acetylglucosamine 2-epimerase (hydrolyzing) [Candidatus Neomarinimicrobiota bacterium]|tara:strand:+ start:79362 stop:80522 length:1161 start_codon:yes stop_codon:yes gene_type:complete
MKKVCVITGTRAEYGLLHWLMEGIKKSSDLELQIIATGMHLSPEFGLTYREIEKDGFYIDKKVEMLISSDTPIGVSKSMGLGMVGIADALDALKSDLVLVLGDRFEIFSAVAAAMIARIPVAHLHGGEATEGLIDEPIRHSITKMSHLHFVATQEYKNRVIQLGEQPNNVFLVGGLGIDNIVKMKLLGRKKLEESLNFELGEKNLLVTYHPVTLEKSTSENQMKELLSVLHELNDFHVIFTMPNADTDGRILFKLIEGFVKNHPRSKVFTSLGQLRYLSCIKHVDGVVGNSSSGLTEVPSFNKGTVNIGDRQRGRLKADSVIDCEPKKYSIKNAIEKLNSIDFQKDLNNVVNPYGTGGASDAIVKILEDLSFDDILKKKFYDLKLK